MMPPSFDGGRSFAALFEHPDQWTETRKLIDAVGYADHQMNRQFTDAQLSAWLPKLHKWGLGLELEVGAVKPWSIRGAKTFAIERKMWDRFRRCGGQIGAIAMDEPLCCCRKDIHRSDAYALDETAAFVALVRKHYPHVRIGDIEPYPFISAKDLDAWIDALNARLARLHAGKLDFFRLDVNWINFTVQGWGSWREVRTIQQHCRRAGVPFSLIYWASGYPLLKRKGLADDSTWYVAIMQQGYDYASVGGRPDQFVIESWIDAPRRCLGEKDEFTFTRSVRDFVRRFVAPSHRPAHRPTASPSPEPRPSPGRAKTSRATPAAQNGPGAGPVRPNVERCSLKRPAVYSLR